MKLVLLFPRDNVKKLRLESGDERENESEGGRARGERKNLRKGTEQDCTSIF